MKMHFAFLLAALAAFAPAAFCQASPTPPEKTHGPMEAAFDYTWVHTNAPPAACGCFPMNGGSAEFGYTLPKRGLSLVADLTIVAQPNVDSTGNSLGIGTLTAGVRYRLDRGNLQPFGEVLAGGAHAASSFASSPLSKISNAGLAFAGAVGGGLDRRLSPRWSWRVARVDYFPTTFDNGSNNHQNNLRLSTGIVLRFAH